MLEPGHKRTETRQQGQVRRQKADLKKTLSTVLKIRIDEAQRLQRAREAIEERLGSFEDVPLKSR